MDGRIGHLAAGTGGGSNGGCGGGAKRIDGCLELGGGVRRASFGSGAGRVSGATVGRGKIAVANQSDQDLCGWVPLAKALAGRGVESGLFDYSSVGSARELGAVVAALRKGGADRVVAVGASVGGRAVITLGAKPDAALDGVVFEHISTGRRLRRSRARERD